MPPTEGPPSREVDNDERLTLAEAGAKPYDWAKVDPDLTDEKPYDQATNTGGKPVSTVEESDKKKAKVTSIEDFKAKKEAKADGPKPPPGPRGGTRLSA